MFLKLVFFGTFGNLNNHIYLEAMWISEQPFSQAPHWAMVVFPAVGGPYNTGKFMCRTSDIFGTTEGST